MQKDYGLYPKPIRIDDVSYSIEPTKFDQYYENAGLEELVKHDLSVGLGALKASGAGEERIEALKASFPPWKELLLSVKDQTLVYSGEKNEFILPYNHESLRLFVELTPVTSAAALLRRKYEEHKQEFKDYEPMINGLNLNEVSPGVIDGIVVSSDDFIIAGVRGGKTQTGKICLNPAGHVAYKNDYEFNPLFDAYFEELNDETGLTQEDLISDPVIIGHFYDEEFTKGLNFVFLARAEYPILEIIEKQKTAKDYKREFEKTILIQNCESDISKFLKRRKDNLLVIGRKPLEMYLQYLTSQEFGICDKALRINFNY